VLASPAPWIDQLEELDAIRLVSESSFQKTGRVQIFRIPLSARAGEPEASAPPVSGEVRAPVPRN
jgi:hypothetical protein